ASVQRAILRAIEARFPVQGSLPMPVEDGRTGATPRDGFRAARLMLEWLFHTSSTTPLACQQVARLPGRVRRQRLLGDTVSFIALRGFRSTVVVPSRL